MKTQVITIENHYIGPGHPVFIICEAGVTNYGDIKLAKQQVDAAVEAKADAVKFQLWKTEELVSRTAAKKYEKELGYNWFERLEYKELTRHEIKSIAEYAHAKGIIFFATPHDKKSADYLDKEVGVSLFKIGSGGAGNIQFVQYIAGKGKPVMISFGFHNDEEVKASVDALKAFVVPGVIAMHCVTQYPTPPHHAYLERIRQMANMLSVPIGYSDHTVGFHFPIAAVALGACVIEKHLTFDKNDKRSLDNPGALLPEEFKEFVSNVREIEQGLKIPPRKSFQQQLEQSRAWAGQSIVARLDIKKGSIIEQSTLTTKRPLSGGLGPEKMNLLVGKRAKKDILKDNQITEKDVA